jgi:hypothetical protein
MSWLDEGRKLLGAVKDFPLWLLIGLAVVADVLFLAKVSVPPAFAPWLWTAAVLCTVLAICRAIGIGYHAWRGFKAAVAARRTFHMSPTSGQCHWNMTKQTDGSTTTQISAHFLVKNLTAAPLGLTNVRLITPRIRGEVLHEDVCVRAVGSNMYGTTAHSGHTIPAGRALPAHAHMLIRGVPKQRAEDNLQVTLGVTDDEGNEQRVQVLLRGFGPPKQPAPAPSNPCTQSRTRLQKKSQPCCNLNSAATTSTGGSKAALEVCISFTREGRWALAQPTDGIPTHPRTKVLSRTRTRRFCSPTTSMRSWRSIDACPMTRNGRNS